MNLRGHICQSSVSAGGSVTMMKAWQQRGGGWSRRRGMCKSGSSEVIGSHEHGQFV